VDESGFYYKNTPILGGKHIYYHEDIIFDNLHGKILAITTIEHDYPYDTRGCDLEIDGQFVSKGTPIIFRASQQVFIEIEKIDKEKMFADIRNITTKPENLKKAFIETIDNRKEWCVSRNRVLGVPVALFVKKGTKEILRNDELQKRILEKMSTDHYYFFNDECINILEGIVDKNDYDPQFFILDVWFESGCISRVLYKYFKTKDEYQVADAYIEGKDQMRGWFQSSLLICYLLEKKLPYKSIISHGFVVDENGNKMSKSKGNVVNLQELIEKYGVEILRLWVMSSDYTGDVAIGEGILEKNCEVYRKIRNVIRYLISVVEKEDIDKNFKDFQFLEKA
ncbi:MAG: class I tRNA ligase family protein, partial [Bacteroidota bacterium]